MSCMPLCDIEELQAENEKLRVRIGQLEAEITELKEEVKTSKIAEDLFNLLRRK